MDTIENSLNEIAKQLMEEKSLHDSLLADLTARLAVVVQQMYTRQAEIMTRQELELKARLEKLDDQIQENKLNLARIPQKDLQEIIFNLRDSSLGAITITQQIRALRQQIEDSERRQEERLKDMKVEIEKKIGESYVNPYDKRFLMWTYVSVGVAVVTAGVAGLGLYWVNGTLQAVQAILQGVP